MKKKIKEGEMEGVEGGMEVRVKELMEEISWTKQGCVDFRTRRCRFPCRCRTETKPKPDSTPTPKT